MNPKAILGLRTSSIEIVYVWLKCIRLNEALTRRDDEWQFNQFSFFTNEQGQEENNFSLLPKHTEYNSEWKSYAFSNTVQTNAVSFHSHEIA